MDKQEYNNTGIKFSIIIPVYNVEAYIAECICSVKNQSYSNWELILVNDGSSDGSGEVCQRFCEEDSRILLINQENQGVSQARNAGLKVCTGDYITFIDGDDCWTEEILSIIYQQILTEGKVDIWLASQYTRCSHNGVKKTVYRKDNQGAKENILSQAQILKCLLNNNWSVWLAFIKSSIVKQNQIYFLPEAKLGEDADWMFRICLKSNTADFVDINYYQYNVAREGSAMTAKSQTVCMSYLEVVRSWIEMYVKNNTQLIGMITKKLAANCAENIVYVYDFDKQNREKWRSFVMEYKMYDYLDDKKYKAWKHFDNKLYFNIYIWEKAIRRKIPAFCRKMIKKIGRMR